MNNLEQWLKVHKELEMDFNRYGYAVLNTFNGETVTHLFPDLPQGNFYEFDGVHMEHLNAIAR